MTQALRVSIALLTAVCPLRASASNPEELRKLANDYYLIGYGSLPLSVVEWLMFDDDSTLRRALE